MKKLTHYLPQMFVATTVFFIMSCGPNTSHDDTDRTASENGSNHPGSHDTSMTDTTRNATMGNSAGVMSDSGFLIKSVTDNLMEIELSKLAKAKATDKQVKNIANQMITDHTQMLNDVKALAGKKNISLPENNTVPATEMGNASGTAFDKMWVQHMLSGHEAKLSELQSVINSTQDADIKTLATKALPKVKMHRDMLAKVNTP